MWVSDADMLCTFINRQWIEFTGRAMEQELGNGWIEGVHPEDREFCAETYRSNFKVQQPFTMEYRLRRADGEYRWMLDYGTPRYAPDGRFVGYVGSCIDITERKNTEKEIELQQRELAHLMRVSVMGELSGAIAHELYQPLTAILAEAQAAKVLLQGKVPHLSGVGEALDDIIHEENRADEIIRRLRGLMKKGEAKSEPIDINNLVDSTLRLVRSELIERKVKVETKLGNDLPKIEGDPVQLQQVLLNLMMNAMDAMNSVPPSWRRMTVNTRLTDAGSVECSITDRGHGIAPEQQERLFEAFFTTKEHGLGLGLPICNSIVKSHRGELSMKNLAAGGAAATFSLPVRRANTTVTAK